MHSIFTDKQAGQCGDGSCTGPGVTKGQIHSLATHPCLEHIWMSPQKLPSNTDVENKRMDTKGGKPQGVCVCDELGDWDCHVYTDVYKIDA